MGIESRVTIDRRGGRVRRLGAKDGIRSTGRGMERKNRDVGRLFDRDQATNDTRAA
jgi:hypothetical protein